MSPELRSALRGLCCGHGWSYAALWRPHDHEPWLLMMEDCYYEERIGCLIEKLRNQTQMVGQGTLGLASISGRHQWIYSDTFCIGSSSISPGRSLEMFERKAEWQHQFTAGIKTIAIICLPSSALVQFGSFKKIPENLKLADQVQCVFRNLENAANHFIHLDGYRHADAVHPQAKFASTISSGIAYHDGIGAIQLTNAQSSTGLFRSSSFRSLRYHEGSELHSGTRNPQVLSMPVVSSSKVTSKEIDKFIDTNSSSHLTNQLQATGLASQPLLPSNAFFRSNYSFPDNLLGNYLNSNAKNKENASQHILKHIPLSSNMFPAKSPLSTPHTDTFDQFGGGSGESCSPYGIQGLTPGTETSGSSKPSFYDTGIPFCDLPTYESFSETPSFVLDFPDNLLASPQDLTPENSTLVQSKNDHPISDLVHSSDQLVEQASDVPTAMMNNDVVGVNHSSSFLVGNAVDNDLFTDMGLDLSRRVIGPDCWEEVMLSMGDGGCSSLTTSFADLRPLEDFDNGFFSDSTLDQLLDSVVGGDAHLLSSPVANLDLDHHRSSTITKEISPRLFGNQTPSASHPPLIQTADISLHEQSMENIVQGSRKEACSFVINQTKKPEESRKLTKKRARPGEGTRPRPKDRQQIQDRVKELRDIVPNGAKCSIDSLLDRTIKHMLYLQSVTKYADKLPHTDEPKIVGDESGVVLQDSSSSGGATWAYEVAGQTMVCPILVEDLKPPGQMLVEMLCEERGFFLEIADVIRGFGLTILKGVMEIRDGKIWARFFVEANQNLTRMDIFLSLVQLLQQANYARSGDQPSKIVEKGGFAFTNHRESRSSVAISLPDGLC